MIIIAGYAATTDKNTFPYDLSQAELAKLNITQFPLKYEHDIVIGGVALTFVTKKGLYIISCITNDVFLNALSKISNNYCFTGKQVLDKQLCILQKIACEYSLKTLLDKQFLSDQAFIKEVSLVGLGARRNTAVRFYKQISSQLFNDLKQDGISLNEKTLQFALQQLNARKCDNDNLAQEAVFVKLISNVLRQSQIPNRQDLLKQDFKNIGLDQSFLTASMMSNDTLTLSLPKSLVENIFTNWFSSAHAKVADSTMQQAPSTPSQSSASVPNFHENTNMAMQPHSGYIWPQPSPQYMLDTRIKDIIHAEIQKMNEASAHSKNIDISDKLDKLSNMINSLLCQEEEKRNRKLLKRKLQDDSGGNDLLVEVKKLIELNSSLIAAQQANHKNAEISVPQNTLSASMSTADQHDYNTIDEWKHKKYAKLDSN